MKKLTQAVRWLPLFLLLALANDVLAGTIKGKVITSDGQPAEFATVQLNDKTSIRVDKNGNYQFESLATGSYIITVSFMGQESQTKTVDLHDGETLTVDFSLSKRARDLNEVVIVGNKYTVTSRKKSNKITIVRSVATRLQTISHRQSLV